MPESKERILIVEPDIDISDLIARQTLAPMGYKVQVVGDAMQAIQEAVRFAPDVIIASLNLPGLSGKDLLVGLSSQEIDVPVIVIAERGMENDVIQAFRLGAADFISHPVREAEVVTAVERVLSQTRARREKEQLARQLHQTNQELQRRVRELTTIFAIGKAVTSITDPSALFDKIIEGAVFIAEADLGWLHLREERGKNFILSAHRNLPASLAARLHQTWDDGLSSLVALSGEAFSISGEPLKRFKVAQLGQSALVVPVKVRNEVVGLLVVMRKKPRAFSKNSQVLLEAVADYASISLVNVRLFRELENRVQSFQQSMETALFNERITADFLSSLRRALQKSVSMIQGKLDLLADKKLGPLNAEQVNLLKSLQDQWQVLGRLLSTLEYSSMAESAALKTAVDLNDLVKQTAEWFQPVAQYRGILLSASLLQKSILVSGNRYQLSKALEGLLYNALRMSRPGGKIAIRVELTTDNSVRISVQDHGPGLPEKILPQVFEAGIPAEDVDPFNHLGIRLSLVKEIINLHGGHIGVESKPGSGSIFSFTLPVLQ